MYLNRNNILSYNAYLNFIVTKRGLGKGWTFKDLLIREFITSGRKSLWVRRYKPELKQARSKFLADIIDNFPEHNLIVNGNTLFIDKKPAIEFLTLPESQDVKSSTFDGYAYLVFDEFIIEGKARHYIGEECTIFSSLMSSFLRDKKDRKIFLLGNKVKTVNPYSIFFNLPNFDCVKYLSDRSILVYAKDNDGIIEDNYKDTPLERILRGTPYYDYALKNTSLTDTNSFILKRPKDLLTSYVININGSMVGVFFDTKSSKIFFDLHCDTSIANKYTLNKDNMAESYMLLSKTFPLAKMLKEAYSMGRVYYNDPRTKTITQELFDYLV